MTRQLCYRGTVNTWECDEMGHMNVRFYLGKAHQGLAPLGTLIGLGPKVLAQMGAELVIEDQHTRFLRELHAGADFSIEGGVVDIDGSVVTLFQEFIPLAPPKVGPPVSATLISRVVLRNVATGKAMAVPPKAIALARDVASDIPDYGQPRSLSLEDTMSDGANCKSEKAALAAGHLCVAFEAVRSDQADGHGSLYPDQYMGYISDGIGNLFGMMSHKAEKTVYERSETIGGAALEYRFSYLKRARVGETIKVLSAPADVREKIYALHHVLVDGETGEPLALARSVHIAFNLETRKSIPVPDLLRRGLEANLVRPG